MLFISVFPIISTYLKDRRMQQPIDNANEEIATLKKEALNSDNKLRSFFDSCSVIHFLIDTKMTLIGFNRAAFSFIKKYYGIAIQEGTLVTSFIPADYHIAFLKNYATAVSGTSIRVEMQFNFELEKINWILNYDPAWDADGVILGISFNAVDITEKIANEHKIASQYRTIKEIAYIQSHQFRRPVTNIIGLVNIFKSDGNQISEEGMLMLQRSVKELEAEMMLIEAKTRK
jgi:hypothetical protein